MPDIDHASFHLGVGKSWESNMCHFPASTILLLTLCQWFRTLYNTQKAIQENQDATIDAFVAICGPIIPTGGGSCRISHWFPRCTGKRDQPAGFGRCRIACRYPSAEFGWCRIVCRHLLRLRIIPGIENSARLPLLINFMTGWQE